MFLSRSVKPVPIEIRKIEFSNSDLQAAMVNYCLRHNIALPDAFIDHIDVAWDNGAAATFVFSDVKPGSRAVSLKQSEIAAALIDYCHAKHMPVPHAGEKLLEPCADSVAMLIHFTW